MLPLQYSEMIDCRKYLLATRKDIEAFRTANSDIVAANRNRFTEWIESLPLGRKVEYLKGVPDNEIPFVVKMICLLYWDEAVNICFYDNAWRLSREPKNMQEWEQWSKEVGFRIWKGISRK